MCMPAARRLGQDASACRQPAAPAGRGAGAAGDAARSSPRPAGFLHPAPLLLVPPPGGIHAGGFPAAGPSSMFQLGSAMA